GCLVFRQYIPSKRARYGIKLYMLSESSTGYVYISGSTLVGIPILTPVVVLPLLELVRKLCGNL
ncbi:hypothetical protein NDU88_006069, partial [Pleurodeles waltl]